MDANHMVKTEIHEREISTLKTEVKELKDELKALNREIHSMNNKFGSVRYIGYGMLAILTLQTLGLEGAIARMVGVPL
jgi:predicted RNase H-like nuclease (RuvC/YqgF family)